MVKWENRKNTSDTNEYDKLIIERQRLNALKENEIKPLTMNHEQTINNN